MTLPKRKHPRLKNYDYSQCGCYHITICTRNRHPILANILPSHNPAERATVNLTEQGHITDHFVRNIPKVYPGVHLNHFVVMPNHIHILLTLAPEQTTSLPTIVRSLKRMTARAIGKSIWQDSYYDVIIRNEAMFLCEWNYIDSNPDKWAEDTLYVAEI